MQNILIWKLATICNGYLNDTNIANLEVNKISFSSKDVDDKTIFIPIEGAKTSGFLHIDDAMKNGATCVLADRPIWNIPTIIVEDHIVALKHIVDYLISSNSSLKVIAITGSTGKTSTKNMAVALLRKNGIRVAATEKNYNTPHGIFLTVINLPRHDDDILFLEYGCRFPGDIKQLTEIVRCNIAIITDVSEMHIGTLKSLSDIQKIKFEILNGEPQTVVLNFDNQYIRDWRMKGGIEKITYGLRNDNVDVVGSIIDIAPLTMQIADFDKKALTISNHRLFGTSFAYSTLCTIALFRALKIKFNEKDWSAYTPPSNRRVVINKLENNLNIIDDSYSAGIPSFKNAVELLSKFKTSRKTAILGDSADLGFNKATHMKRLGENINIENITDVVIVNNWNLYLGILNNNTNRAATVWSIYWPYKELYELCIELIPAMSDNTILIKAANYLDMSVLVERLFHVNTCK